MRQVVRRSLLGSHESCVSLGVMCVCREGVEKNTVRAVKFMRQGAVVLVATSVVRT
jgi:TPR repeat protein